MPNPSKMTRITGSFVLKSDSFLYRLAKRVQGYKFRMSRITVRWQSETGRLALHKAQEVAV
jgi:hypothetical protein